MAQERNSRWLEPATEIGDLRTLLKPYPAERMRAQAVNRAVNSVKNDNEECIAPVGEPLLAIEPGSVI